MLIEDKHGDTIFFPWGARSKQGYVVNDPGLQKNISKFYSRSRIIFITTAILLTIVFHNFESVAIIIALGALWFLVHYLYTNRITESLPIYSSRYTDILLNRLVSDDNEAEYEDKPNSRHPVFVDQSNSKPPKGPLRPVRLFLHPLESGCWVAILWAIGAAIALIWNTFHTLIYSGSRADVLTVFFITFFVGLGFLIYGIKGESLGWRGQNPWVAAIIAIGLSLLFLYFGFIVGK